jgi:hypothetical protein
VAAGFEEMIDRVTRALVSRGVPEARARDAAFHMSDWKDDLDRWAAVWEDPDAFDDERLTDIVYGFLMHVPNHVNAAKKLLGLGPIEDVFGVGVLEDEEEGE